ncbi:MAG: S41 family peptidase, partial [Bacteroidota bacterium]
KQLQSYQAQLSDSTTKADFGLFLTQLIGQLGDRHASVRGYDLPDEYFLPFIIAPHERKVIALEYVRAQKSFKELYADFPYLTAINGEAVDSILPQICPEEVGAPEIAYHFRAVRELRHIQERFAILGRDLPKKSTFTFSGEKGDTVVTLPLLHRSKRLGRWSDRSEKREKLNDSLTISRQFQQLGDVAYTRLADMVAPEEAPHFYNALHDFMHANRSSNALIIDIRGNGGGTRDLLRTLSPFLVHPDSIYVANIAYQRANTILTIDEKSSLHARYLFSLDELDESTRLFVNQWFSNFRPTVELNDDLFSRPHFMLLRGSKDSSYYHYNQPVYVLMDERSFSAASIMASALGVLPNVQLVGTTTDGSSGNSRSFYLPNTQLRIKASTMLSFQANGDLLDGIGTSPDITIPRSLDQIKWETDAQLEKLIKLIEQQ